MGEHDKGNVKAEGDDVVTISTPGSDSAAEQASPRSRPEALSLFLEFIKMSRTSAILLIAFVLTAALYMFVRHDPVVAFGSPPRADSSQTETSEPASGDTEDQGTADQPTGTTVSGQSETPTSTDVNAGDDSTSATGTSVPVGQRGLDSGDGADTESATGDAQTTATQAPSEQTTQQTVPSSVPVP